MNDIMNTTMQTPIEIALGIDENGMTTVKKLFDFLGMSKNNYARWYKTNITDNQFAEENIDYFPFLTNEECGGQASLDSKITAHFAKKLSMMQKNERGEEAREYFSSLEERVKQKAIDYSQLSPELQMFQKIFNSVAQQQLEQKRLAEQQERTEKKVDAISETFRKPSDKEDFKAWCKKCIARIVESDNFALGLQKKDKYALAWNESYERLNAERPCRLKQRVKTAQGEALQNGATPSKVKDINPLTIIAADKDLKPIYEKVIKEMMIYYCVN